MSGTLPGSTSEAHDGVPSGAARNCTFPPKALSFWRNHQSLPFSRTPATRSDSISVPSSVAA